MSSEIIDGKLIANRIKKQLVSKIKNLNKNYGLVPNLKIILIGNNPVSKIYVTNKLKQAKEMSIDAELIALSDNIQLEELTAIIEKLNNSQNVSGIIIQLPLPSHIPINSVILAISPNKDVDGFHPINVGKLSLGTWEDILIPCTPLACINILKNSGEILEGKHAVIIGRSNIVGKPLANLLIKNNLTVTICHSFTNDISKITHEADIVICATGKPLFFDSKYFNKNSFVIDVGISRGKNGKILGDVNFIEVSKHVRKITPVPGGVGPNTIISLMENTIRACCYLNNINFDDL